MISIQNWHSQVSGSVAPTFTCLPQRNCIFLLLYSCMSYMFNRINIKVCILTASVTCWHIRFHISTSFLNTICHFKVRDTWVSKEPHDVYYCFCIVTLLAFWETLWQDVASDLEIYFLSLVPGLLYSAWYSLNFDINLPKP
jgi:hypothetical protein